MVRVVLVGPGRSRQGLGPHYGRHLRAAGASLVAVVGRDSGRTAQAAVELTGSGPAVAAYTDVEQALAATQADGLVIASPIEHHADALQAALAAGVATLCEKPLLAAEERVRGNALIDGFESAQVLLMEACQWPQVLEPLAQVLPWRSGLAQFRLGLSPAFTGRSMLVDSLSHFLSLVQAMTAVTEQTRIEQVSWSGVTPESRSLRMQAVFSTGGSNLHTELLLEQHEQQPRPAWLEVNGCRADRVISLPDYEISFVCGDRRVSVRDPLACLVYGFVQCLRYRASGHERTDCRQLRERTRLYADLVDRYDQQCPGGSDRPHP